MTPLKRELRRLLQEFEEDMRANAGLAPASQRARRASPRAWCARPTRRASCRGFKISRLAAKYLA